MKANLIAFAKNLLLAISIVTLAVIVPLNSVILGNPYESVCVSCLAIVYAAAIAVVGLWLQLCKVLGKGRLYGASLTTLTVLALVAFLHVVQITTIPKVWRTAFVIASGVGLSGLVAVFAQRGIEAVRSFLLFALVLTFYEAVNFAHIVVRPETLSAQVGVVAKPLAQVRASGSEPHVFLLVLDEFALIEVVKEGNLDSELIPNLTVLASGATWYRQAIASCSGTECSIPALLTGRNDGSTFRKVFLEGEHPPNLFSVLVKTHSIYISGYALPYCEAFASYLSGCQSMTLDFSDYGALFRNWWARAVPGEIRKIGLNRLVRDPISRLLQSRHVARLKYSFSEALDMGQDFARPTFTYIHVGLPHFPYIFRANGDTRWDVTEDRAVSHLKGEELVEAHNHYREQIHYTDRLFGAFLAELKARNLYDGSLIIVTSDHGISFDPREPGRDAAIIRHNEGVARVPLLVKMPGQHTGRIDDRRILNSEQYRIILNVLDPEQQASQGSGGKGMVN